MSSSYGYDAFVLDENYYTDSFYNDMVNSIQIKNTLSNAPIVKKSEGFVDKTICKCSSFARQINSCHKVIYEKTKELSELKNSIFIFYILLIASVFIIVSQRMTINTLNNFIYIMKLQPNNQISGSNDLINKLFN